MVRRGKVIRATAFGLSYCLHEENPPPLGSIPSIRGADDDVGIQFSLGNNMKDVIDEYVRRGPPPIIKDMDEYRRKVGTVLPENLLINFLKKKIEDPQNYKVIGYYYFFKSTDHNNLYESHPRDLLEGNSRNFFFIRRRITDSSGGGRSRPTKNGYWKSTTKKVVKDRKLQEDVKMGMKHKFVFYTGKSPKGTRTNYVMHEYYLDDEQYPTSTKKVDNDYWVLCEVFKIRGEVVPKISEQAIIARANACIDEGYEFSFDSDVPPQYVCDAQHVHHL